MNDQLKKAGVQSDPIQFVGTSRATRPGYNLLRLQCRRGKVKFDKMLDLLATFKENPYLAGIEEFSFKCDQKNKQQVELNLTVSTMVKVGASAQVKGG